MKKTKVSIEVALPEEFKAFLKEVSKLIDLGDENATVQSDDLLQCGSAYGGLNDSERGLYGFRLFPDPNKGVRTYWDFSLQVAEIRAIANGQLDKALLWRCANPNCENRHMSEDSYCPNCDNVLDHIDEEEEFHNHYPNAGSDVIKCMVNLRRIAFAVIDYCIATGRFPPPYTTDAQGNPLHSWRTLILPQLEQQALYDRIVLDEPWDSPRNRELWNSMPSVYHCEKPSNEKTTTTYVVVTGDETIWPNKSIRTMADAIWKGLSNVVILIEQAASRSIWMSPFDRQFSDMFSRQDSKYLSSGHVGHEFIAAFADGHVAPIPCSDGPIAMQKRLRELMSVR